MTDNKVGKYLLYASGEIVLVIIGILVALYIIDMSEPISDYSAFNQDGVDIYSWKKFYMVNNTFQELAKCQGLVATIDQEMKAG